MSYKSVTASKNVYDDGIAVIMVKGKIVANLSATEVVRIIESLMKDNTSPRIIINLKHLSYIDSFSFNWILNIYKRLEQCGGTLAICEPNEDILELFDLTNFGKALPIYLSESDAREALKTGNSQKRFGI